MERISMATFIKKIQSFTSNIWNKNEFNQLSSNCKLKDKNSINQFVYQNKSQLEKEKLENKHKYSNKESFEMKIDKNLFYSIKFSLENAINNSFIGLEAIITQNLNLILQCKEIKAKEIYLIFDYMNVEGI